MLIYPARRVALAGATLAVALAAGACGARPSPMGEPVIIAAPAPDASVSPEPEGMPMPAPSTEVGALPGGAAPRGSLMDPTLLTQAATDVEPNTTLAALVYDRETGDTLLSVDADRPFRSASLVKLMIAIDALRRGATPDERNDLTSMISLSDDDVANAFWMKGGRSDIVTRTVALLGLTGTEPPESPGRWGEVTVTANDLLRVYQYVMKLPAADHALIVGAMARAPRYAADGFDQHFGVPDGLEAQWAIKQGWGNNAHAMVLHSTALVGPAWRHVVILLTEHPLGSGWRRSAASVSKAAAALNGLLPGT